MPSANWIGGCRPGYDAGRRSVLATPRRQISVSVPLRRNDGTNEIVEGDRGGVRSGPSDFAEINLA
jgi:hypothetical protein